MTSHQARTHSSHLGVVPEHEVQKILHRRVLEQFTLRQKLLNLKYTYNALKNNVSKILLFANYIRCDTLTLLIPAHIECKVVELCWIFSVTLCSIIRQHLLVLFVHR